MTPVCVFCRVASGELPSNIIHRDERLIAFLDRSPLFLGHTLVLPIVHVDTLDDLAPETAWLLNHLGLAAGPFAERGPGPETDRGDDGWNDERLKPVGTRRLRLSIGC